MERKRGTFKVKLSAALIRCPLERTAGFPDGISRAVKLDKSTQLLK
jgi:hypothetical protein